VTARVSARTRRTGARRGWVDGVGMGDRDSTPVRRLVAALPSAAGAPVMGTGIVSVAFGSDHRDVLADALLAVALVLALGLAGVLVARAVRDRASLAAAARAPASLTVVAATCVLGTRLAQAGVAPAGAVLLGLAVAAWAPLLVAVVRAWRTPAGGDGFLVAVATQGIAALCAALASPHGLGWLAIAALVALAAGLALYVFAAASFDLGQVVRGHGEQWVAGGALAIAALAAGDADAALRTTGAADGLVAPVRTVALVLWVLAMAWLPVLVAAELRAPRTGFDARRWSTVFPVGMYAAMSFAVGQAAARPAVLAFARAWIWVAGAVWALVAAGSLVSALRLLGAAPQVTAERGARA
jgi:Voltage-dependent anion channel